ncbi:hypothetical protein [Larkinella soli]|uniref:hypothetical protein n=1 Tax=Larkinella soli TaxID=1770527 RepID=UPI000FFB8623|nr:hypothetical protein [Larkinella soli]
MRTELLTNLSRRHLEVRCWQNEIEFAGIELPLFQQIMRGVAKEQLPAAGQGDYDYLNGRLRHYERLIPQLKEEVNEYNHEVAMAWQQAAGREMEEDHRYLREEMDDFRWDLQSFKKNLWAFLSHHTAVRA